MVVIVEASNKPRIDSKRNGKIGKIALKSLKSLLVKKQRKEKRTRREVEDKNEVIGGEVAMMVWSFGCLLSKIRSTLPRSNRAWLSFDSES